MILSSVLGYGYPRNWPPYHGGIVMFVIGGLIGIVPAILMIVGLVSVFHSGVRHGRRTERRRQ